MAEVEFKCLGDFEIVCGQRVMPAGGPLQRGLLAVLLLNANQSVSADRIISALWDSPPDTALGQVQTRIWRLRQLLQGSAPGASPSTVRPQLITRAGGYGLMVDPETVDLLVFDREVQQATTALAAGRPQEAVSQIRGALALFRGPAFANVAAPGVNVEAAAIEERRLAAIEQRIEIELTLGLHVHMIAELRELVAAHPYQERLRHHLMRALHRSGRRAEAVAVYREGHRMMVDGAGLEPSRELKKLHHAILTSDVPAAPVDAGDTSASWARKSRDLPRDAVHLVGRCPETTALLDYFRRPRHSAVPLVAAISGVPGVGKTALAVRVAHMLATELTDGQLFAWVGGKSSPAAILHRFLRTLGIPENEVPDTLEERSALYRACMINRRAVLLIDDAQSEAQVRPLLPAGPGSATLITSRRPLTALDSVHSVDLPPLREADTVHLLSEIVGAERAAAEPGLPDRIVRLCEGLPLAVRAAGARLRARPHWTLARFAATVEDRCQRLDALSFGDLDVRAAIASSYVRLEPPARRLFQRLGTLDRATFTGADAGGLIGVTTFAGIEVAEELVEARLAHPGSDTGPAGGLHYRIDELCRLFARERALLEGDGPGPASDRDETPA
jgi:DNA-binding SARP family transcriptional activator